MAKSYEKVSTLEETAATAGEIAKEEIGCLQLYLRGGRLTPEQKSALASRQPPEELIAPQVLCIHPESIRQITYAAFWSMCILAVVLTKILIPPDVIEDSDLKRVFGYNNVRILVAFLLRHDA